MALDAVEQTADNREVQVQFQAEILDACRLNVARARPFDDPRARGRTKCPGCQW